MGDVIVRFVGRRRRILDHLLTAEAHANLPMWQHDPIRRDAVAFRLTRAAKLARDRDCPPDIDPADWSWLREASRFAAVKEPSPDEFRRVVEVELPEVRARLAASVYG